MRRNSGLLALIALAATGLFVIGSLGVYGRTGTPPTFCSISWMRSLTDFILDSSSAVRGRFILFCQSGSKYGLDFRPRVTEMVSGGINISRCRTTSFDGGHLDGSTSSTSQLLALRKMNRVVAASRDLASTGAGLINRGLGLPMASDDKDDSIRTPSERFRLGVGLPTTPQSEDSKSACRYLSARIVSASGTYSIFTLTPLICCILAKVDCPIEKESATSAIVSSASVRGASEFSNSNRVFRSCSKRDSVARFWAFSASAPLESSAVRWLACLASTTLSGQRQP
jgi:hypothetical protein